MKRLVTFILCTTIAGWLTAGVRAHAQGVIEPLEDEEQPEEQTNEDEEPQNEAEAEETEETVDETVPPPYTPPSVSFRSGIAGDEGRVGPPLPNTNDLPTIDPEIFFDPSTLPGPLPPPPSVAINARPGTKFADIQADLIIQDRVEELVTLEGNVVVVYEQTTIRAEKGFLNEKDEIAAFWGEGGVEVEDENGTLNTDDLTMEFNEDIEKMTAVGNVKALMYAKTKKDFGPTPTRRQKLENAFRTRETRIEGDNLDYWWGTREFHVWMNEESPGLATIVQQGRTAKARDIHYVKEPDEEIRMTGQVELWQENGRWLYEHKLIDEEKNDSKVLKAIMDIASTVTCDTFVHSETTKITKLDGQVVWTQEDKNARADSLLIDNSPKVWEDPSDNPPGVVIVDHSVREFRPDQVKQLGATWTAGALVDDDGKPPEDAEELEEVPESEYGGQILIATGDVYGQQKNGDWLFKYEVIEPDEDEKVKKDAREPAEGWAEKVIVHLDTEDIEATGDVRVKQPHQWGRADELGYVKGSDQLTLTGEVQMKRRDKQLVLADLGILFLTTDIFKGLGHVESSMIVNTEDREASDSEGGLTLLPIPGESAHVLQDPNAPPPAEEPTQAGEGGGASAPKPAEGGNPDAGAPGDVKEEDVEPQAENAEVVPKSDADEGTSEEST